VKAKYTKEYKEFPYYCPFLSAEKGLIYFLSALSLRFNVQKWKL